ncbi:hypothetical protein DCAR_0624233 [Daucus carota subsp. sativus]|uniref:phosphoribosylaminoimidazolesuccinocarboxamide synthase n=1 Tax=Daucus carota subsp. sativus TaxID=79200 RepID=A0AAF1B6B7_DAUCS|nr:hypothetical protein DCAR_0624233 [Daucus carota subsp. sativus]
MQHISDQTHNFNTENRPNLTHFRPDSQVQKTDHFVLSFPTDIRLWRSLVWWLNTLRTSLRSRVRVCVFFPVPLYFPGGYVTGSTDTSLWTVYKNGVRNYCGNILPDAKLPANILTLTTKAASHDVPVTPDEIVKRGLMTQDEYDEASTKALSLFEYGQVIITLLLLFFFHLWRLIVKNRPNLLISDQEW